MTYNGYVADLFFNACAIALWAAFLWRVLDGPRFRVWVTVLLPDDPAALTAGESAGVRKVHSNYHIPISNTATGLLALEKF